MQTAMIKLVFEQRVNHPMPCDRGFPDKLGRDQGDRKVWCDPSAHSFHALHPREAIPHGGSLTSLSRPTGLCTHRSMMRMFARIVGDPNQRRFQRLDQLVKEILRSALVFLSLVRCGVPLGVWREEREGGGRDRYLCLDGSLDRSG